MTSGVYLIRNTVTDKVYVGSSKNTEARCRTHFCRLRKGNHHSVKLQRSFDKHGEPAFEFCVISEHPLAALVAAEQVEIDRYQAAVKGYNVQPLAESSTGRKLSLEHRAKLSAAKRGRQLSETHRQAIARAGIGRTFSKETREKIRVSNMGRRHSQAAKDRLRELALAMSKETREKIGGAGLGRVCSPETRAKMSAAHVAFWKQKREQNKSNEGLR